MLPKYIEHKIDQLDKTLDKAYALKIEIEKWAKKKNIDTFSNDWHENVVNDYSAVCGISKEGLESLLENKNNN